MITLSPLQVDLIRGDIRQNGIELSDLEDDLLDHICTTIENEGRSNAPFEEVYNEIKQQIFPDGLREIQEQTNYLLTQKYNTMKKAMNVIGIAGSLTLLIGSAMKVLSMTGPNEILLVGTTGLTLGFLPILLILSLKQTDLLIGKIRNFSGFLGAEAFLMGVFMQILHYQGGKELLLIGVGIFMLIFLPLLVKSAGKEVIVNMPPVSLAVILLIVVSALFAFNNKKPSGKHREELVEINLNVEQSLESKLNRLAPLRQKNNATELSKTSIDVINYIGGLKEYIILQVDPNNTDGSMNMYNVLNESANLNDVLITNSQNHQFNGKQMQRKLDDFESKLKIISPQIKTVFLNLNQEKPWLESKFLDKHFYNIYTTLTQIQLEVASLEIEILIQTM